MSNKTYYFIILFLISTTLWSQTNYRPASSVKTGIFYDLAVPFSGIQQFDGSENSPANTLNNWKQIYFELSKASVKKENFKPLSEVSKAAKIHLRNEVIPIAVLGYDYSFLGEDLTKFMGKDSIIDLTGVVVPDYRVFSSAPFKTVTHSGSNLVFSIPGELFFSNFGKKPVSFLINFDDDAGWRKISLNEKMNVSYATSGKKVIRLKAIYYGNQVLYSSFHFNVKSTEIGRAHV